MLDIEYARERAAELRAAMDKATTEGRDDSFNFYRGQLLVWDYVIRNLKAVA